MPFRLLAHEIPDDYQFMCMNERFDFFHSSKSADPGKPGGNPGGGNDDGKGGDNGGNGGGKGGGGKK
jgi:hypothetical protein